MAAQTIKGAVFDMDGLMIDTEKLYLRFWKARIFPQRKSAPTAQNS